ncbi:MAG: patatin-like phospholipase family protein [Oligoflexus sp.]|nr:patatin-like phospholipase family protein [Oligoflexus sp.]
MYKILALDGGDLRAIFQARLIERLEQAAGQSLTPNLYAGTSAGAIVACALLHMSAAKTVEFFLQDGLGSFCFS